MMSFILVLFCFLLSFLVHIFVHKRHPATGARAAVIYAPGLSLVYGFGRMGFISLPWSAALLYVLLSCTAILFYLALTIGTELPTSIILASLQKKKKQKFTDLLQLFTDRGLIWNRVDNLEKAKLVAYSGGKLKITPRGAGVWLVMAWYRRIFHRQLTE